MNEFDPIDLWFNPSRVKARKNKSTLTGFSGKSSGGKGGAGAKGGGSVKSATYVKPADGLKRLAEKHPEVMVKITGNGTGINKVKAHLDYISRNGEIPLENQDGEQIHGRDSVKDLRDEWRAGGIPQEGDTRETLNIIFSMPAGTPREAVLNAVRNFAQQEFYGHQYVFAEHRDEDHPHVHLALVTRDAEGRRINPRKQDLFRWRVEFAEKLREQGVEASASRRQQRFQHRKPEKFALRQHREEAQGEFKSWRPRKQREMPKVYQDQAIELAKHLAAGERPENPAHERIQDINRDTVAGYERIIAQLRATGQMREADKIEGFMADRLANQATKNQTAYDQAKIRLERSSEIDKKGSER